MQPFTEFSSRIMVLAVADVDTDQIVPAQFLKVTDKQGLREALFFSWRKDPDFVLNRRELRDAKVLVVGDNFGCGSSREHAPWALVDWGFRAVVSTSFADIFRANALKNGLLPIVIDSASHQELVAAGASPAAEVAVDLAAQQLQLPTGRLVSFSIDGFAKRCLLQGIDQVGYVLSFDGQIADYEAKEKR